MDLGPFFKTQSDSTSDEPKAMGGATVLKVGEDNFATGASKKKFLTPHFLVSGGTKYCLDS